MRITELGDQIHSVYRELFEVSVKIIEQTLHGSVARGGKARAEHLASVAKGMELKLQYVISIHHFSPEVTSEIPIPTSPFPFFRPPLLPHKTNTRPHHRILSQTDPTLTNPQFTSSLKTYTAKLSTLETDLSSRQSVAQLALKGYETAGKGMSEIASKYVEAIKEGEEIRREIERLEERRRDAD